jgi:hypothetical protein
VVDTVDVDDLLPQIQVVTNAHVDFAEDVDDRARAVPRRVVLSCLEHVRHRFEVVHLIADAVSGDASLSVITAFRTLELSMHGGASEFEDKFETATHLVNVIVRRFIMHRRRG